MSSSVPLNEVCAVIYGAPDRGELLDQCVAAACEQDSPPAQILVPAPGPNASTRRPVSAAVVAPFALPAPAGRFAAGIGAGAATGRRWLWLLDGLTVPEPDTLSCLLAATRRLGVAAAPLVLASKVLDDCGRLHPDAIPRHEVFEKERSVEAAAARLVQLRTVCHGSLLVSASAVEDFGLPRSDLSAGIDILEWSARMLRGRENTGYLVPASVAIRRVDAVAPGPRPRRWIARACLLTGGAWSPTEKLWEAFLLGEEALDMRTMRRRRLRA